MQWVSPNRTQPYSPPGPEQVVCKPGSIKPHKKFTGEIYALSKEEGGRHTPFFTNYKPQFFFRTADVTGTPCVPYPLIFWSTFASYTN